MAPDPWLATYDVTCHLAQDIAEKIHERNRCQRRGENPAKVNMALRTLLQNLKEKIEYLKDSLLRAVSTRQITQLEGDRRQNLVDDLLTREKQLQASYKNEGTEPDLIRSSLMTGKCHHGVSNPWLLEEPEETRGLGFGEIRQQQQRIIADCCLLHNSSQGVRFSTINMERKDQRTHRGKGQKREQDAGLDALSSVLSRQKQMGQDIGNELDEQNEIIDDLTNLVENTDDKIRTQTRRVKLVDKKSTSCGMLVVIVLLLIAIVVVAVWPTK
ncbi:syntaxin-8 isoform X2 [Rhinatrema bivittatum]|uniref:syntaxin-8 isoform X2 n=1 Tax=Rhinatrema bivittatum TaxID=194408 RepID=UPI00112C823F|nr:syntaxin-8 isoform X2 [Rhinatrema bivittatum]